MVRGKGDKQRIVPLSDELADEILGHDGYCFPGRFGGMSRPRMSQTTLPPAW